MWHLATRFSKSRWEGHSHDLAYSICHIHRYVPHLHHSHWLSLWDLVIFTLVMEKQLRKVSQTARRLWSQVGSALALEVDTHAANHLFSFWSFWPNKGNWQPCSRVGIESLIWMSQCPKPVRKKILSFEPTSWKGSTWLSEARRYFGRVWESQGLELIMGNIIE